MRARDLLERRTSAAKSLFFVAFSAASHASALDLLDAQLAGGTTGAYGLRTIRSERMDLSVQELDNGITVVALRGRLDTVWAGEMESSFTTVAGSKHAVVLDLSEVSFLGSLGMRMFVQGGTMVIRRGGKFAILSPDPNITKVLKVAAIDSLIPILHDRDAALAAILP
jgi:anti-anti-sigma factor